MLALGDVARQRQVEKLAALLERAAADLDREHGAVLAPMARLEGDDFPGAGALRELSDRRFVLDHIEVAWMHSDQLFATPAQALAGLPVDIHDPDLLVHQKKGVRRTVDKRAEAGLARAQLVLGAPQLRDVLHDAELANRTIGLVPCDITLAVHHANHAVRPHHPVFDVVARTAVQRDFARRGGLLTVLGMDEAHPALLPLRKIERLHAENAARLVGKRDVAVEIVALPPADMCDPLGRVELAFAFMQAAEHRKSRDGIAQAPSDLLKQALLLRRPNAILAALVQAQQVRLVGLHIDRHCHL